MNAAKITKKTPIIKTKNTFRTDNVNIKYKLFLNKTINLVNMKRESAIIQNPFKKKN